MKGNKEDFRGVATVFIDLDDTLWSFSENSAVSLAYTYDKFDLKRWCESYDQFHDIYLVKNAELWDLYHHGKVEKDFLLLERFAYVLRTVGYDGDNLEALCAEMNEEYLYFLSLQKILKPGARELLVYLNERGYDVNVLSNGFKGTQERKMRSSGITELIHYLALSDDCGFTKPMPEIFDYAMRLTGAEAASTVMIGDNYDADICGAKAAGWRTIYYNWRDALHADGAQKADAEVQHLSEVQDLL